MTVVLGTGGGCGLAWRTAHVQHGRDASLPRDAYQQRLDLTAQ
jgi:hypothetical protein